MFSHYDSWQWHAASGALVYALLFTAAGTLAAALFFYSPNSVAGESYLLANALATTFVALIAQIAMRTHTASCCALCSGTRRTPLATRSFLTQAVFFLFYVSTLVSLCACALACGAIGSASKWALLSAAEARLAFAAMVATLSVAVLNFFGSVEQFADPDEGFCCFRDTLSYARVSSTDAAASRAAAGTVSEASEAVPPNIARRIALDSEADDNSLEQALRSEERANGSGGRGSSATELRKLPASRNWEHDADVGSGGAHNE